MDAEDIPQERISSVLDLLRHTSKKDENFLAAKLLTSWGIYEGLIALEENMEKFEGTKGNYSHRLYGYDDTYRQILLAVIRYFANMAGCGHVEQARTQIYSPLFKIINLANTKPFEIANLFDLVERKKYSEYLPPIKKHLAAIIDRPEVHRWKIYDAIVFLKSNDPDFVDHLLKEKNKSIYDFKPTTQN